MDAYAWRVSPEAVYKSDGKHSYAMDPFLKMAERFKRTHVDFIREGFPNSPEWRALGGNWSSFDSGNWRMYQVPPEAWTALSAWLNAACVALGTVNSIRWQGPNEQFGRGFDRHAYARCRNVYIQPSFSRRWTSPALWGWRGQLVSQIKDWMTLRWYDNGVSRASSLCANVYADWTPGVTINTASNVKRIVENLVIVNDLASSYGVTVTISEFGFDKNQVPEGDAERVRLTRYVMQCMGLLSNIDYAYLYWDSGIFGIDNDLLATLGDGPVASADEVEFYVESIRQGLAKEAETSSF